MAFVVGAASIRVSPDLRNFHRTIADSFKALQPEAEKWGHDVGKRFASGFQDELRAKFAKLPKANIEASADTAKADAALDKAAHRREAAVKANADTKEASAVLDRLARTRTARIVTRVVGSDKLKPSLAGAGIALSPALIPLATGIGAALAGVTASFGAAAVGAGLFGLTVKTVLTGIVANSKKLATAQAAVANATTAATKKTAEANLKALTSGWSPDYKKIIAEYQAFTTKWQSVSQAVAVPALAAWLPALNRGMAFLKPLLIPVAAVFKSWGQDLNRYFASRRGSAEIARIASALGRLAASQIRDIGRAVGFIAKGIAALGRDAGVSVGSVQHIGTAIARWAAEFDGWAHSAKARADVRSFMRYVRDNGPDVASFFRHLAGSMGGFVRGAAGLGGLELRALDDFLTLLDKLPDGVAKPLTEAAGAFLLLSKTGVLKVGIKVVGWAARLLSGGTLTFGAAGMQKAGDTMAAAAVAMQRAADTMAAAGLEPGGKTPIPVPGGGGGGKFIPPDVLFGAAGEGPAGLAAVVGGHFAGFGALNLAGRQRGNQILAQQNKKAATNQAKVPGAGLPPFKQLNDVANWATGPFVAAVTEAWSHIFENFMRRVGSPIARWFRSLPRSFAGIGHGLASAFDASRRVVASWGHAIANRFDTVRHAIASAWDSAWGHVTSRVRSAVSAVTGRLASLGHAIATRFDAIRHGIASVWDRAWNAVSSRVRSAASAVGSRLADLRHSIANRFDQIRHSIASTWDRAWNAVTSRIRAAISAVTSRLADLRHSIASRFDQIRHNIASAWDTIWNNTVGRVRRGIASVVSWFGRLPGRLLGALRGLGHSLGNFGAAALNEMLSAFKRVGGTVLKWLSGFVGRIVSGVKKLLHIGSPSGVFAEIGANMMRGLERGIKGSAHLAATAAQNAALKSVAAGIGGPTSASAKQAQAYARRRLSAFGWGAGQMAPLIALWNQESGWSRLARNKSSGAYGIPQALPASKMGAAANPPKSSAAAQINWGLSYIKSRYGSPAGAWAHEKSHNWYGAGSWNVPRTGLAGIHQGEMILPARIAAAVRAHLPAGALPSGGPPDVLLRQLLRELRMLNGTAARAPAATAAGTAQALNGTARLAGQRALWQTRPGLT